MILNINQKLEYVECLTDNFVVSLNRNPDTFKDYYVVHNKQSMESTQLDIDPENSNFIPCLGEDSLIIASYSNELRTLGIHKLNLKAKDKSAVLNITLDSDSALPDFMDVYMWPLDKEVIMIGYSPTDGHSIDHTLLINTRSGQHLPLPLSLTPDSDWNSIIGAQKIRNCYLIEFFDTETSQYNSITLKPQSNKFTNDFDVQPVCRNKTCTQFIGKINETSILFNNEATPLIEIFDHFNCQSTTKEVVQPEYFKTISNTLYSVHKTFNGFNIYTHLLESDEVNKIFIPIKGGHLDLLSCNSEGTVFRVYNVSNENKHFENRVIQFTNNTLTIIGDDGFYDEKTNTLIIHS